MFKIFLKRVTVDIFKNKKQKKRDWVWTDAALSKTVSFSIQKK